MKRVRPITIRPVHADDPDNKEYTRAAFAIVFSLARKELQKQRKSLNAEKPSQSYPPNEPKVDNFNP